MWGSTKANTVNECTWANNPLNGGASKYDSTYFNSVKNTVCPNGVLVKEYDAAAQIMGGDWRMPTKAEFDELLSNTTNEWVQMNGVNGRKFTSKTDETKYIFIPAAGYCGDGSVSNVGGYGGVLSSSLYTSNPSYASDLNLSSGYCIVGSSMRCYGLSVRGVL